MLNLTNIVKNLLQTLMSSLRLLILRVKSKAFIRLIMFCLNLHSLDYKQRYYYLCQNTMVIGYQWVYLCMSIFNLSESVEPSLSQLVCSNKEFDKSLIAYFF
jgi:hypothetical protein